MGKEFPTWLQGLSIKRCCYSVVFDNTNGMTEWCGLECWCRMPPGECVRCGRHLEFYLPKNSSDRRDCIGAGIPVELTDVSSDEFRVTVRVEDDRQGTETKVTAKLYEGLIEIDAFETTI